MSALLNGRVSINPVWGPGYTIAQGVAHVMVSSRQYRGDLAPIEAAVIAIARAQGGTCARRNDKRVAGYSPTITLVVRGDIAAIWAAIQTEAGATDTALPSSFTPVAPVAGPPADPNARVIGSVFTRVEHLRYRLRREGLDR